MHSKIADFHRYK